MVGGAVQAKKFMGLREWEYAPRSAVSEHAARALLSAFDALSDEEHAIMWALDGFERAAFGQQSHYERKHAPRLSGTALIDFNAKHARHPKGHPLAGKFRPMLSRLLESLWEWRRQGPGSDRGDDPFAGIPTSSLRRVARARGLKVPKLKDPDEDRKSVRKAILTDLKGRESRWRAPAQVDRKTWDSLLRLASGEKVTAAPEDVGKLVDAIGKIRWKRRKGEPSATFNLANLQVTGEGNGNAFRRHLRDRPRSTMPQLPTGITEADRTASGKSMADWEAGRPGDG